MKKYDIIYSIGRDCACALYLQQNGLRLTSGPFDWLTNADYKARFDLMLSDFNGFLDKKYLKLMPKPTQFPADKNNDYYENTKTGLYFWHDFPADKSFESAYPEVKQKYDRRIQRFYENIKNKNRILLIWFSHVHNTADETVLDLCNKFCKKFNKNIDFLLIEHKENVYKPECYKLSDNIIRYFLHTQKNEADGTPTTLGNEELILPIFKQYKLIVPWYLRTSHFFIKFFIKFICIFIPLKKWRKILKSYINKY